MIHTWVNGALRWANDKPAHYLGERTVRRFLQENRGNTELTGAVLSLKEGERVSVQAFGGIRVKTYMRSPSL